MQTEQEKLRYRNDALFFDEHREELLQQYPEHWVAIYDQQVVGAANRLPQLLKELEERGLPQGDAFIERLSAKEDSFALFLEERMNRDVS